MTKRKIVKTAAAIAMSLVIAITPQVGVKAASVVSVTGDGVENGGAVVKPGQTIQLYANVIPDYDGEDTSVSWAVYGNESNNTFVTEDGLLTIGLDETAEGVFVLASSNSTPDSEEAVYIETKENDPTPTYADITSVTVSGPDSLAAGTSGNFTVDIQGNGSFEKGRTWSVEGNTSTDTTIVKNSDGSATIHVGSDETADTLTVIATPLANPNVPGSKTVTITHNEEPIEPEEPEEPTIVRVEFDKGIRFIIKGSSDTYIAEVVGTGDYDPTIVWSLIGNTSEGSTIDENGNVFIAADETASQITVRAASKADPDKYADDIFEVLEPEVETKVTDVQIGGASEIKKGSSDRILGRAVGTGDIDPSVTWTVSGNTSKDTTVDAEGNVTVGKDETAKAITVTATSVQDPTVSTSWTVTIKEEEKSEESEESTNTDKPDTPKMPEKPSTTEESSKTADSTAQNNESTSTAAETQTTASGSTSTVPKTGDSQNAGTWGLMGIVSTALAAAFVAMGKWKAKAE